MRIFLLCIILAFAARLGAQCPGNGYASSTEIIVNEDFSNGNQDFSSPYTYCNTSNCLGFSRGYYTVGKDASNYSMWLSGKDHTTGSGDFLIANSDGTAGTPVWCQTIRIKPRTNYNISAWFSNVYNYGSFSSPAELCFAINGSKIGSTFFVPSDTGEWKQKEVLWYSGNNSSVSLCIQNMSTALFGASFGIDDISLRECICNYPATVSNDTTICVGDSASLRASYGTSYVWSPVSTLTCIACQTAYAKPTTIGTTNYFVAVTDTSTCISTAIVKVTLNPLPKPKITGDSVICNGNATILKATLANAQYYWNTGGTDSFITVTKPGTYWVEVNVKGCNARDSFKVKEINTKFNLGKDTALCDGQAITLNVNQPGDTITWQDGSHNKSLIVTKTGKYWATLQSGSCSFTDTINIQYKPNPVINLGADVTLCEGEKTDLDAGNPGASYIWSTAEKTQTITVNKTGKYWVQVTNNGCTSGDTININFQAPIKVSLGNDTSLCEGGVVQLKPTDPAWVNPVFIWQDGSTAKDFMVTNPGKYWVYVKSGSCSASDTINVNFKPKPVLKLGKDITVCADEKVILDAGIFADTYIWNTGETTKTIEAKTAGKYSVQAINNGCVAEDTVTVNFLPLPVFSLGNDTALCEGQTLLLHANVPNVTYLWQDSFISPYSTVTKAGTYWAKVDNGSCSYTDTIHVKYYAYPKVNLGDDTLLCPGQNLLLNAQITDPDAKYFWNDSTTSGIKEVSTAGKYWVKVSLGQCFSSDTIQVFYNDSPYVNLGKDTTFCGVRSWRLDAGSPGADYLWNTGEKTRYINVSKEGVYWARADFCGLTSIDTASLGFINYVPEDLLMPNAFSPNGDFVNDTLQAVGISRLESFEWRIYNRWGELVYKSDDITKGWDGKYKGAACPDGLYHWELSLRSSCLQNSEMSRTGIVHLMR